MTSTRKDILVSQRPLSYCLSEGVGRPIIFLHGWGGSAESWKLLWEALRAAGLKRPLLALDFPGFGQTPSPQTPWRVRDYAQCVIDWLDGLGITSADLVSHSFGGRVSWYLLADWPDRFQQAVLIAPAGIRHALKQHAFMPVVRIGKSLLQLPGLRRLFPLIRKLGYRLIGGQDYLQVDGVMKTTFQQVINEDLSALLPRIQQPVEIFFGVHDSYVPWTDGKLMEQQIPTAHLTVFEDGKHGLQYTHAPAIAAAITPLLTTPTV